MGLELREQFAKRGFLSCRLMRVSESAHVACELPPLALVRPACQFENHVLVVLVTLDHTFNDLAGDTGVLRGNTRTPAEGSLHTHISAMGVSEAGWRTDSDWSRAVLRVTVSD